MGEKSQLLVTIAIPTYNRADSYLPQALKSAVKQTYQNIEIIVSDNCSTDNTGIVVKSFTDPRIRYFRQAINIKANDNFNFLLKEAKGCYFLLLHDDDMIDSDFIETCLKAANYSQDIGIIRTGMRRIDSDGRVLAECPNFAAGLSTEDFFICWFKDKTPMHLCMSLFNTNYLRKIGGFNSKHQLFQDVLAEVKLAAKFGRMDIESIKASYRMHPYQYSCAAKIKAWCEDSVILHDTMYDLISENQGRLRLRKEGGEFFFRHNYHIAGKVKSFSDRIVAYLIVFHNFGYLYSMRRVICRNALYCVHLMKRIAKKILVRK
jgi:glycosyltransferase involved in cell wall biosynthesis